MMINRTNSKRTGYLFDRFISLLLFIFFFVVVVVPNSLRFITLPLFFLLGFILFFKTRTFNRDLLILWLLGSFTTFFYIFVGLPRSYPDSVIQVIFVYVVSPLIWILIFRFVFLKYNLHILLKTFVSFSFLGAITIPLFLAMFLLYGPHVLTWLISEPNAVFTSEFAGVTTHVSGSLSFAVAGFFSGPKIIKNPFFRLVLMCVFLIAVLLSGRAALFLSFAIGIFFSILTELRNFRFVSSMIVFLIAFTIVAYLFSLIFKFNVFMVIQKYLDKILEVGGQERILQAKALLQGIYSNALLGSGHGVGVDVIRNRQYPWRYELLYLATLYRVGLVGFIIYSLPAFFVVSKYLRVVKSKFQPQLISFDIFIFVGFVAAIVISAADPYFESFEFQWMFWGPVVYFFEGRRFQANAINVDNNS